MRSRVYATVVRPSVRLSVCPSYPTAAAASLLLRAQRQEIWIDCCSRSAAHSSKCGQHRSLITLRCACDDASGGRCTAQIPQLDTPQASKESHNSIHSQTNYGRTKGLLFGRLKSLPTWQQRGRSLRSMAALLIELCPPSLKYISSVYPPDKGKFVDLWPQTK